MNEAVSSIQLMFHVRSLCEDILRAAVSHLDEAIRVSTEIRSPTPAFLRKLLIIHERVRGIESSSIQQAP